MQTIVSSNLEFGLYESMVYGELRPFLPEHSSTEYSERLVKTQEKELENDAYFEEIENLLDEAEEEGSDNEVHNKISENKDLEFDINFTE